MKQSSLAILTIISFLVASPAFAQELKERWTLKLSSGGVSSLAISADGNILAIAGKDNTLTLWNVATGKELTTLPGGAAPVVSLAFSADGKTLAAFSKDQVVRMWDVRSGNEKAVHKKVTAEAGLLTITTVGNVLLAHVAHGREGTDNWAELRLLDVTSGKQRVLARDVRPMAIPGIGPNFNILAFTPDAQALVVGSSDAGGTYHVGLTLVDPKKGPTSVRLPELHLSHRIAFSKDGKTLATATENATQHHDLATGKLRTHYQGIAGIALIGADLRTVVSVGPKDVVKLWQVPTGLEVRLIAKKNTYQLDFGGKSAEEFRKPLDEMAKKFAKVPFIPYMDARFLPASPEVDLVLEIRNTSNREIEIWVGGEYTDIGFELNGPGTIALNCASMMSIAPRPRMQPSHAIKLAPGAYYGLPIHHLQDGDPTSLGYPGGKRFFWTAAGEYTLTAAWHLAAGAEKPGNVTLFSAPVTLKVE